MVEVMKRLLVNWVTQIIIKKKDEKVLKKNLFIKL